MHISDLDNTVYAFFSETHIKILICVKPKNTYTYTYIYIHDGMRMSKLYERIYIFGHIQAVTLLNGCIVNRVKSRSVIEN